VASHACTRRRSHFRKGSPFGRVAVNARRREAALCAT
jgi:hypothetical protein